MKKFFAILLTLILAFACVAALAEDRLSFNTDLTQRFLDV